MHLGQHWPGSLTGCCPGGQGLLASGTASCSCCCCTWLNSAGLVPEDDDTDPGEKGLFLLLFLLFFLLFFLLRPSAAPPPPPAILPACLGRWTGHCCTEHRTSPSLQLHAVHASSVHLAPSWIYHYYHSVISLTNLIIVFNIKSLGVLREYGGFLHQ